MLPDFSIFARQILKSGKKATKKSDALYDVPVFFIKYGRFHERFPIQLHALPCAS